MRLIDADALKEKAVPLLFPTKMEPCGHIPVPVQAVVVAEIEQAPTIEVEPVRHSFWESYSTSAYGGYKDGEVRWLPRKFYRCERCRKGSAIRSHYCPSCGAKMEG